MHAWTGGNRRSNTVRRRDNRAQQHKFFEQRRTEQAQQRRDRHRDTAGPSRASNPIEPSRLGALVSERSRNAPFKNATGSRHKMRHGREKKKSGFGQEIQALGSLYNIDVFDLVEEKQPSKKRRKDKPRPKEKREKREKKEKRREEERPAPKEVQRTQVIDMVSNTLTVYEGEEEKRREERPAGEEIQRMQILDADRNERIVDLDKDEITVNRRSPPPSRHKPPRPTDVIPTKRSNKRNRSPNAHSPRTKKHRPVEVMERPQSQLHPEFRSTKRRLTAGSFQLDYGDERVITPEIPSKEQDHRPTDPRLSSRTVSMRRRQHRFEPVSDPIQSPNWSSDVERIRKPTTRRTAKDTALKWPNKDLSWMGPMNMDDFSPEIAAIERRLFTPDKSTGRFQYPPKRVPTPRLSARFSPKADTVKSGVKPRPMSTRTSHAPKPSSSIAVKKSKSRKKERGNKKAKEIPPIASDNLTLVEDLIMVDEAEGNPFATTTEPSKSEVIKICNDPTVRH